MENTAQLRAVAALNKLNRFERRMAFFLPFGNLQERINLQRAELLKDYRRFSDTFRAIDAR